MSVDAYGFDTPSAADSLWEDGKILSGDKERSYEYIRESTYLPFGVCFQRPTEKEHVVELNVAFSLRSRKKAHQNRLSGPQKFSVARRTAKKSWEERLDRIHVQGGTRAQQRTFYTALYHSLIKPSEAHDESPFGHGTVRFSLISPLFGICIKHNFLLCFRYFQMKELRLSMQCSL